MSIKFRTYNNDTLFGADYYALRDFLIKLNNTNYSFGRWDWMITHSYLDKSGLPKIGLWEDGGKLAAVATYDCSLGSAYLLALPGYEHLREEMLLYAREALAGKDGIFRVLIADGDAAFGDVSALNGFFPTQEREFDSVFPIEADKISYTLPEGFSITSIQESFDMRKYAQVLWKGFNHELNGEGLFTFRDEDMSAWELDFKRPNVNMDLKIAVVAPNGDFVSYCGMWQDGSCENALVEPVATDPAYRKMGLGRAAVLEALRRCGRLGAKRAFVGSPQQFYYSIGFRPHAVSTWWNEKER